MTLGKAKRAAEDESDPQNDDHETQIERVSASAIGARSDQMVKVRLHLPEKATA